MQYIWSVADYVKTHDDDDDDDDDDDPQ